MHILSFVRVVTFCATATYPQWRPPLYASFGRYTAACRCLPCLHPDCRRVVKPDLKRQQEVLRFAARARHSCPPQRFSMRTKTTYSVMAFCTNIVLKRQQLSSCSFTFSGRGSAAFDCILARHLMQFQLYSSRATTVPRNCSSLYMMPVTSYFVV